MEGNVWISDYPDFAPVNITENTELPITLTQWHPSGDFILLLSETSIQRYDVNNNQLEEIISLEEISETNNFNDAQYSPDGEFIIVNRNDLWGGIADVPIDDVWLFDKDGYLIQEVFARGSYVRLNWLADSQHLFSIGYGIYSQHAAIIGLIEISEKWESHSPYEPENLLWRPQFFHSYPLTQIIWYIKL